MSYILIMSVPWRAFGVLPPREGTQLHLTANLNDVLIAHLAGPSFVQRVPADPQPQAEAHDDALGRASGLDHRDIVAEFLAEFGIAEPPAGDSWILYLPDGVTENDLRMITHGNDDSPVYRLGPHPPAQLQELQDRFDALLGSYR